MKFPKKIKFTSTNLILTHFSSSILLAFSNNSLKVLQNNNLGKQKNLSFYL